MRSGRGGFWVDDSVSRLESRKRVGTLMRLGLEAYGRELCLGRIHSRGPWALTLAAEEPLL